MIICNKMVYIRGKSLCFLAYMAICICFIRSTPFAIASDDVLSPTIIEGSTEVEGVVQYDYQLFGADIEKTINGNIIIRPCSNLVVRKEIFKLLDRHFVRSYNFYDWVECTDLEECPGFMFSQDSSPKKAIYRPCNEANVVYDTTFCNKEVSYDGDSKDILALVNTAIEVCEQYYNMLLEAANNEIGDESQYNIFKVYIRYNGHIISDVNMDGELDFVLGAKLIASSMSNGGDGGMSYKPILIVVSGDDIYIVTKLALSTVKPVGVYDINNDEKFDIAVDCIDDSYKTSIFKQVIIDGNDPSKGIVGKSKEIE